MSIKYAFWNNKGGTGKTSLSFQAICRYAEKNPDKKVLAVDVCPQANLSELFLGGLANSGSDKLLERQGKIPRCSLGGYFEMRLPSPFQPPNFNGADFISNPSQYNNDVPTNIDLVCGDPILELQANAINTLSNMQNPSTDPWLSVIDWLNDFFKNLENKYNTVFMDCNPSFSLYTQIALASTDRLLIPVMADDSSRRAVQNAFSLVYGLKLPSEIYTSYAFSVKLKNNGRPLPKVHLLIKNRLTQYITPASAYEAVLRNIKSDVEELLGQKPDMFTFSSIDNGFVDIRDFQTAGVVAFAKGVPFSKLRAGKQNIGGHRVQVQEAYKQNCIDAINDLVDYLE